MSDTAPLFIDLSGYAFTGKHAVIDLMREIDGYHVPHFQFEFALLRIQGGILDLEHALCGDWSPMRSDAAIRRFKKVVRRLGTRASWAHPRTWVDGVGWNYDERYHHRFFDLSDRYVSQLVMFSWNAEWPFALSEIGDLDFLVRRIGRRLGWRRALEVPVSLAHTDRFVPLTRAYLQDLLTSDVEAGTRAVVMHNAFEPFNPQRSLKFFDRAKAIVVDRDPRDSYVQHLTFPPNAVGVQDFITRYRVNRLAVNREPHPDVLRIQFEDLVLDYDRVLAQIFQHLGEDRAAHVRPRQYFDPAVSSRNVGLWRTYPHQDEIRLIEQRLPEVPPDECSSEMTRLSEFVDGRENNILLLRFVAASLVIFSHSFTVACGSGCAEPPSPWIPTSFGTIAVNIFFATSGLLIAKSYGERGRLVEFARARVLRIYPALVAAVVFTACVIGVAFTSMNRADYLLDPSMRRFLLRDATMVQLGVQSTLPGVFAHNALPNAVNDPLWTLPYELRMYALVALAGVLGLFRRPVVFNVAAIAALAALAGWHASGGAVDQGEWMSLFERLGVFFLTGTLCYVNRRWIPIDTRVWLAFVAAAAALYLTPWFMVGFWAALTYSVFAFSYLPAGPIRAFNRLGDYSYGLYIYGFPIQQSVAFLMPAAGPWLVFALSMAVTLPLAVASWVFLEARALRLKSRRASAAPHVTQMARA